MSTRRTFALLAAAAGPLTGAVPSPTESPSPPTSVEWVETLAPEAARLVAFEVLERNPEVARLRREAAAAAARAPQLRALPDPMAALTTFLLTPETRTGPQQLQASLSQRFPWSGKLQAAEREAIFAAAAADAQADARALEVVTEARRLLWELAYLDAEETIIREDRYTLERFEQLARARYAIGAGISQPVVKIQAEITRTDQRLLELTARRASLAATVNALRDRPADTAVAVPALPSTVTENEPDLGELRRRAAERRPELVRERARIAAAGAAADRYGLERRPDVTVGLAYTLVNERDDAAGRAMPPAGNGDDVVGITVGVNLPVRKARIEGGIQEAERRRGAAEEALRSVAAAIERDLGDLEQRVRSSREQIELFDRVLTLQAEESLRSAEGAYAAGTLRALDLLDAERVLLQTRLAAARARADLAIARARLEGATATPLTPSGGPS